MQHALEASLQKIREGKSTEEVLQLYPEHAQQLRPLLLAALQLSKAQPPQPSPTFTDRGRRQLLAHMAAHPRRGGGSSAHILRLAGALAGVLLALTSVTTAMAQSALPGDILHPIKLASERAWRAVHPNTVQVDLEISQRRLQELLAVEGDPSKAPAALSAYAAALDTLKRDLENLPGRAQSAQTALHAQKQQVQGLLESRGSTVDEFFTTLDEVINNTTNLTPLATAIPPVQLVVPSIPTLPVSEVTIGQEGISVDVDTSLTIVEDTIQQLLNELPLFGQNE